MVDNTNINTNTHKYIKAEKIINNQDKNRAFTNGVTYKKIVSYIEMFQQSVEKKKNPYDETKDIEKDSNIEAIFKFLEEAEKLMVCYPPINKDKQRFGNVAFRSWYEGLEKLYDDVFAPKLDLDPVNYGNSKGNSLSDEIKPYILECFGNSKRIDFGTGHELNFFCVLSILYEVGFFQKDSLQKLVQIIFKKYISVCKNIISTYNLEPAGSKGVYGLDDYFFLFFIFGAAELIENEAGIEPNEIQKNLVIIERTGKEYMFFDAVYFNLKAKNGHLPEHSPILYQISNVPKWEKIAKGLIKMYEDEVLKKIVVSQHFYFGSILKFE